ncbi:MAG: SAF domain-containing protein, partial [Lachnospiraceae bacterium]|nr:SAF domain-containing protein [Lachnospiraceae bacterium]
MKFGEKMKATDRGDNKILVGGIALVAALIVFILLCAIQNKLVKDVEVKEVVVAAIDIPQGFVLDESNIETYFKIEKRDLSTIPSGSYTDGYAMIGKVTARKILANEIINPNSITEQDIYGDVEDPVELSIDVSKIGMGVAGTVRAGDLIDIKVIVDKTKNESLMGSEEGSEGRLLTENDLSHTLVVAANPEEGVVAEGEEPNQGESLEDVANTNTSQKLINTSSGLNSEDFSLIFGSEEATKGATGNFLCVTIAQNVKVTGVYTS